MIGRILAVLVLLNLVPSTGRTEDAPQLRHTWKVGQTAGYRFEVKGRKDDQQQTTTGSIVFTARELDRALRDLEPQQGTGTGFVVGADGYLVTCAHVVEDAIKIEVVLGEKTHAGEVVAVDEAHDLAIVRIEARDLPALVLGLSKEVELAQEVRAFGYPLTNVLGESIKVTRGSVSGFVERKENRLFQVDAAINPGNSGGPIVAEDGRVVGVATSKLTGSEISKVGFAVPVDDVLRLLGSKKIDVRSAKPGPRLEGPDLARSVVPAVALLKVTSDPLAARGDLFDLEYAASFSTTSGAARRFPIPAAAGGTNRVRGRVLVDGLGKALAIGEGGQLPFLMGEVATLPFDELSREPGREWTRENRVVISRDQGDPLGRRRSPLTPRALPPQLRPPEPPKVVMSKPAIERYVYEILDTQGAVVSIQRTYELATLEKEDEGRPAIEMTETAMLRFDTALGQPIDGKGTGILSTFENGKVATITFEHGFDRIDPELLAREGNEAADRVEEMRRQRDEQRKAVAERLAEARRRRDEAAGVNAAQGGVGDLDVRIRQTLEFDAGRWNTQSIAYSPNGKWVAVGKLDRSLRVFATTNGGTVSEHEGIQELGQVTQLAYSPDGKLLASGGSSGAVLLWTVGENGGLVPAGRFAGHSNEILDMAISGNGRVLSGSRKRVRYWDLATSRELAAFPVEGKGVWISEDGRTGFASNGREIYALDLEAGTSRLVGNLGGSPQGVAFSPDGTRVFTTGSGKVDAWSTANAQPVAIHTAPERDLFWTVEVSPDGKLVSAGGSGRVVTWDVARPGLSRTVRVVDVGYVQDLAFAWDSKGLAAGVAMASQPVRLFAIESEEPDDPPADPPADN